MQPNKYVFGGKNLSDFEHKVTKSSSCSTTAAFPNMGSKGLYNQILQKKKNHNQVTLENAPAGDLQFMLVEQRL